MDGFLNLLICEKKRVFCFGQIDFVGHDVQLGLLVTFEFRAPFLLFLVEIGHVLQSLCVLLQLGLIGLDHAVQLVDLCRHVVDRFVLLLDFQLLHAFFVRDLCVFYSLLMLSLSLRIFVAYSFHLFLIDLLVSFSALLISALLRFCSRFQLSHSLVVRQRGIVSRGLFSLRSAIISRSAVAHTLPRCVIMWANTKSGYELRQNYCGLFCSFC
mmetsp:Transcript_53862/g.86182  ORF Transcript_53862/g.86182 Transcript_53862/m.86182 type:complete len:212 (-) Transcript_53862:79-714(-)